MSIAILVAGWCLVAVDLVAVADLVADRHGVEFVSGSAPECGGAFRSRAHHPTAAASGR